IQSSFGFNTKSKGKRELQFPEGIWCKPPEEARPRADGWRGYPIDERNGEGDRPFGLGRTNQVTEARDGSKGRAGRAEGDGESVRRRLAAPLIPWFNGRTAARPMKKGRRTSLRGSATVSGCRRAA
ncbi:hypothetical protein chiPu_0024805, partial [Chiloscyllium punctatum]|nr:hypothetical protein [Chiloscyllium punctatum]